MFKLIVQFLFLLLLWYGNKQVKGSWLTSSGILIGIYVVCSFMGIIELNINDYTTPYDVSYWLPMLEFDLFLLVFLLPFRQFNETKIRSLRLPSKRFLDIFSSIIIILSFYAIIFFIGSVRYIFSLGDLGAARNDMLAGESYFESGIMATIATVSSANYVFAIVLYFIYRIIGDSKKRCTLLLIASISEPLHVLSFVGRDGIVFWIFTFAFCYVFFKPYMPKQMDKKLRKTIITLGCVLLIPFLMISVSRFGNDDSGTGGSIVTYLGEQFVRGPAFFGIEKKPIYYGISFPLYWEIIGQQPPQGDHSLVIGDWMAWHFGTFLIGLYMSLNLGGLITVAIGMYLLFKASFGRAKKQLNFGQFTIYLLFFQLISQGVFYFRHSTRGGGLFIITTLVLALIFASSIKTSSTNIVLYKVD